MAELDLVDDQQTLVHHTGVMKCRCLHSKDEHAPRTKALIHAKGKCKWLCCQAEWNDDMCRMPSVLTSKPLSDRIPDWSECKVFDAQKLTLINPQVLKGYTLN